MPFDVPNTIDTDHTDALASVSAAERDSAAAEQIAALLQTWPHAAPDVLRYFRKLVRVPVAI